MSDPDQLVSGSRHGTAGFAWMGASDVAVKDDGEVAERSSVRESGQAYQRLVR
jgi:hypothetical protein